MEDVPLERRIVAALVLMLGLTALAFSLYLDQLEIVEDLLKRVLEVSKTGLP